MKRIVVVLALLVCAGASSPASGAADIPGACTRQGVAALFKDFIDAYNEGDVGRLEAMWASEPDFMWYSVSPGERERAPAYERHTLGPYFVQRHVANDHLRVRSFRVGPPNEQGQYGIAYHLRRSSDESRASGRYHGKAGATTTVTGFPLPAVRCQLIVWSMGKS